MFLAYSAAFNVQTIKSTVLSIFKERLKNGFIRSEIMVKTFQTFTPVSHLVNHEFIILLWIMIEN